MSLIDDKYKLERLDQLIRLKATGNLKELAERFNTSQSTICRTIKELKEIGCPIYFSRKRNSYCYKYEGKLIIEFEALDNYELDKIKGGFLRKIFSLSNNDNEGDCIVLEKQKEISFSG